jgi:DNA-binding NarL/FixJ family response regulator
MDNTHGATKRTEVKPGALRFLLADDHPVVRRGLRTLLEQQPEWQVVAEAGTGREAVEQASTLRPDLAILDISMPTLNGLEATRQILKTLPQTKILILTVHDSDSLIDQILSAGARGYLLKSDAGKELVTAVNALREDKMYFTPRIAQLILEGYLQGKRQPPAEGDRDVLRLTPREREVLQLLAEGKSSKEVAVSLDISVKTAETHRSNIMQKLDCHSAAQLVRYAIRNRIIEA